MKQLLLSLSIFCVMSQASAISKDTSRASIPTITYFALDSIIHAHELTAVYYWPAWCAGCREKVPDILSIMQRKNSLTFISINDPESRSFLPKYLINPDIIKGYFRIQRYGRNQWFSINDKTQFRYFNWYYTRDTTTLETRMNQFFLIFNKSGKLLYHNIGDFTVDSLRAVLAPYN
jgi:thiol-disulfide isomerase/thioredoxin